uniref:Uncharacterized protein n=1 Tax=viral metagenome TaxID=1070528 RepID=A0A6M3L4Q5_9ZZZZ
MEINLGDVSLTIVRKGRALDGYGSEKVIGMEITIPDDLPMDKQERARIWIHALLESVSVSHLLYGWKHDDIEIVESPLAIALVALGWDPPD